MNPRSGFTLLELAVVLAISGVMLGASATFLSRMGRTGRAKHEAAQLVDNLRELRSQASLGVRNPCLDFPDARTVRLFSDTATVPDGYGAGDRLIRSYALRRGVRALSITGGMGATHAVCFESRGVAGSAGTALLVTLGVDSLNTKRVRLLPSTGLARVL